MYEVEVANAVLAWFWNRSPMMQVEAIFGTEIHPEYRREKPAYALASPLHFWASLDKNNQRKLVLQALDDQKMLTEIPPDEHEEAFGEDQGRGEPPSIGLTVTRLEPGDGGEGQSPKTEEEPT